METAGGDYPMISGRVSTGVWGGGGQAQGEGKGRAQQKINGKRGR